MGGQTQDWRRVRAGTQGHPAGVCTTLRDDGGSPQDVLGASRSTSVAQGHILLTILGVGWGLEE